MHYSLTRATVWNLAGYIYLLLASFISIPIMVHSLGVTQFGIYSLIIASLTFVSAINFGLPQAVVRALALAHANQSERQSVWATSSLLFIISGVLAGIIAVLLVLTLHLAPSMLAVIFATGLINNVVSHYLTLPQAEGHFGYFNTKSFIIGTSNTLVSALASSRGFSLQSILSIQLFSYLLTLVPLVYFSLPYFPHPRDYTVSLKQARSLLIFGFQSWIGKIVGQIQSQYAKYILATLSPLSLSAYVIAQSLVQKTVGGVVQLATAIYPASARSNIRAIYYRLQIILFVGGLLTLLCFRIWGLGFLSWWLATPELAKLVHSLLTILIWYFVVLLLTPLPATIIEGRGKPGLASFFAFATTLIEIALALYLLPRYGVLAPAYAALVAVIITTPPLLFFTDRSFNKVKSNS